MTHLDNITARIAAVNAILSKDFYDNVGRNDEVLKQLVKVMLTLLLMLGCNNLSELS